MLLPRSPSARDLGHPTEVCSRGTRRRICCLFNAPVGILGDVTTTTLDSIPNGTQVEASPSEKRVLLLKPRGFCAGVVRAIDVVRIALDTFGAPIYVRREIVHNRYVVNELAEKGAIFVHEIDDVPDGQRVIYSAHGVSPVSYTHLLAEWFRRIVTGEAVA